MHHRLHRLSGSPRTTGWAAPARASLRGRGPSRHLLESLAARSAHPSGTPGGCRTLAQGSSLSHVLSRIRRGHRPPRTNHDATFVMTVAHPFVAAALRLLVALAGLLLTAPLLSAQVSSGSFYGSIDDPSGGLLAAAQIEIRQEKTGF